MRSALTKETVKNVLAGTETEAIPVMMVKWWGNGLVDKYGQEIARLEQKYPDDAQILWYQEPGYEKSPNQNQEYRFGYKDYQDSERHSIAESVVLLPDWAELDQFLEHFPNPNEPGNFQTVNEEAAKSEGQYRIGAWWRVFHERFWSIRGMENLMLDYYDNMEGLKILGDRLIDYYKVIVDRYYEAGCDAIFTSDDLGHQKGPMMSPEIFHELYFPLYQELVAYVHSKGMKFFLHSCGDNSLLLQDLAAAGVDVLHPIQKGCMDLADTVRSHYDKMAFLVGMDVQDLLRTGTTEEVRAEIREIKKLFVKEKGCLMLAMGNGIMPDAPFENIEAALDEMYGA